MDRKEMQHLITEALSRRLGDGFQICIQQVFKTNLKLDGLTILREGENTAPTIYLDPYYKDLENNMPLDGIADGILSDYSHAKRHSGRFDISPFLDFNGAKDKLYVRLINRHLNTELLEDVPHRLFLDDFAVTVRCLVESPDIGTASFLVSSSHMKLWGINTETLLSSALKNTREKFGIKLESIDEILGGFAPELRLVDFEIPIWVMTNRQKTEGAAAILFEDVLEGFADAHGSFYVIFSSVHEVLLIPTTDSSDIDFLSRINQEVNVSEVMQDEILGTKAYYYAKGKGFVL